MSRLSDKRRILVVDDDPKLAAFVNSQLKAHGFDVEWARDGREGLDKAALFLPDAVILDLFMPVMGGIDVLTRLREWFDRPVVILSAIDEEQQKVQALDLGADDYLTKPFGTEELLARVRSTLRRAERTSGSRTAEQPLVTFGDVTVDLSSRTVSRSNEEVSLTRTEYELLRCLASNAGKVLTHRELLQDVWGPEYGGETEYLRTFIKQLRRKLEPSPSRPKHIVIQPGIGYRLVL